MAGYAVIIGLNSFEYHPASSLKYCEQDAKGIAEALIDNDLLSQSFKEERVRILLGQYGTRNNILTQIDECFSRAGSSDAALLFIASHGYSRRNKNYIYCFDTRAGNGALKDTSCLTLSDIRSLMANCDAGEKLIFLDCCHASSADFIRSDVEAFSIRSAKQEFQESFCFFNACRDGQAAHECEQLEHGVWSHFLIEALCGRQGWPETGILATDDLQKHLSKEVTTYVRKRFHSKQQPDYEMKSGLGSVILGRRRSKSVVPIKYGKRRTNKLDRRVSAALKVCTGLLANCLTELQQDATKQSILKLCYELEKSSQMPLDSPVTLLGFTGTGKTTLLNSLIGSIIGASGGGGPQSAASLVVKYRRDHYRVRVQYVDLETLQTTVDLILQSELDAADLFLDDTVETISDTQYESLSSFITAPKSVNLRDISIKDLTVEARQCLSDGEQSLTFSLEEQDHLAEFIDSHTNSSGRFSVITDLLEVEGPFPGLPTGIRILDLPGLGELDPVREAKAKEALLDAQQLLIVTNNRGIQGNVRDSLLELGIVASVLMNPSLQQVTFAGTRLDEGRVSARELELLGLNENYTPKDAVAARFTQWKGEIRSQWQKILAQEMARAKGSAHRSTETVIEQTKFVPCSPEGYLCLSGLQRDPTDIFKSIFDGKSKASIEMSTGIGELRAVISNMVSDQRELRSARVEQKLDALISRCQGICNRTIEILNHEILLSERERTTLDEIVDKLDEKLQFYEQINLKQKILQKQIEKLKDAHDVISERWRVLKSANIKKALDDHVGKTHFMTLAAAIRRFGMYESRGKSKAKINIPERIGMAVRTPLLGFSEQVISEFEEEVTYTIRDTAETIVATLTEVTSSNNDADGSIVRAFSQECAVLCDQFLSDMPSIVEASRQKLIEIRQLLPAMIDESVGEGFGIVMSVALDEAKGTGARGRLIDVFSDIAERLRHQVCNSTDKAFREKLTTRMKSVLKTAEESLYLRLENGIRQMHEARERLAANIDEKDRIRLSKAIQNADKKLSRLM